MTTPIRSSLLSMLCFHGCVVAAQAFEFLLFKRAAIVASPGAALYQIFISPPLTITLAAYALVAVAGLIALWASRLTIAASPLDTRAALAVALLPGVPAALLAMAVNFVGPAQTDRWIALIWPITLFGPSAVYLGLVIVRRISAPASAIRVRSMSPDGISSFPRMLAALSVGALSLWLCVFLLGKLHLMAQVRGWMPGRQVLSRQVTQLWHQEKQGTSGTYWVSWDTIDIRQVGNHRTNLESRDWATLHIGDSIPIIRVPGNAMVFTVNDIYSSAGNFLFDIVLLLIGIAGLRWAFRTVRGTPDPPVMPGAA